MATNNSRQLPADFICDLEDFLCCGYSFLFDSEQNGIYYVKLRHSRNGNSIVMGLSRYKWFVRKDGFEVKSVKLPM